MATVTLTGADFGETITKPGVTFVDFWAEWCGPCRMFGPIFEDASERHPEITFAKVDTEVERELAGAAGITSIPTLMAFRDGVLVFNQAGALPAPQFQQLIDAVNALDMRAVAQAIAKQSRDASAD